MRFQTIKRAALAGMAAVLLPVGVSVVVLTRDSEPTAVVSESALAKPPIRPDPVPKGPIIKTLPANCGVSKATAHSLAPSSKDDGEKGNLFRKGGRGDCQWYSLNDGKETCGFCPPSNRYRNERVLNVDIAAHDGLNEASPIGQAIQSLGPGQQDPMSRNPPKPVAGLGEEATVYYSAESDTQGAVVLFRYGNSVTKVTFKGWDVADKNGTKKAISEATAVAGAFKVAAETARSLGAAARPVLAGPAEKAAPPIQRMPRPCDLVPIRTLDKVARGAERKRANHVLVPLITGSTTDACQWEAETSRFANQGVRRLLTVTVAIVSEWRPGEGLRGATREYLRMHHDARWEETRSVWHRNFSNLAGPGEQAFSALRKGSIGAKKEGRVLFRLRNVLVEVTYSGTDDGSTMPEEQSINGAYTVAADVAKSLAA